MLNEKIESILKEIQDAKAKSEKEIEELRIHLLGKKGEITQLFDEFRTISADRKREFGQKLNNLKNMATAKIEELRAKAGESTEGSAPSFDMTMPGDHFELGTRHPISITREEIISIFRKQGYALAEGPEIEDDHHVFEALNFPPDHPARDMQDTFFISSGVNPILLRTHTSSVQVRTMETRKPPIRVICPGRVFRNEAISARAHCIFHQVEGLYVDKNVSFADLKQTILIFVREMFGPDTKIRMRPSFPSPSRAPRWTSAATSAAARAAISARAPAGWRLWVPAWLTPTYWKPAASTPRSTPDSLSEWVWSASPCSNGRSRISASTLRTISASSANSRLRCKKIWRFEKLFSSLRPLSEREQSLWTDLTACNHNKKC